MGLYQELKSQREEFLKTHDEGFMEGKVYRGFSIFFNLIFIPLKITPNMVTWLSVVADFLVIYFMSQGQWILAGVLVNLAPIFDSSDGEVARYNRKKYGPKNRKYGVYLDNVVGTIGFSLMILAIGYYMGHFWIGICCIASVHRGTSSARQARLGPSYR